MVDARWAGVLFTADPVTGRRGQAVIDAAPGLGESVVSGSVDPEHLVVDPGGEIVSRHAGAGGTVVRALPGGGTETVAHPSGAASLDDADVRTLARLGRRVEALFGAPQDIEWALDGDGRAWLTQSRPITTLYPLVPGRPGLRLFLSANVAQGVFRPFTPAGLSAARHLASGVAGLLGAPVDDPEQGPPMLSEAGRARVRRPHRRPAQPGGPRRGRRGARGHGDPLGRGHRHPARPARARRHPALAPAGRAAGRPDRPPLPHPAGRRRRLGAPRPGRGTGRSPWSGTRPASLARCGGCRAGRNASSACAGCSPTASSEVPPRIARRPPPGSSPSAWPPACSAVAPVPASSAPCCAACRTTSPPRWTSRSGTSPSACATTPPPSPPSPGPRPPSSPGSAAPGRRCSPTGLDAFLAAHGRRAVAEIDLGLPRWSDDPTHLLGVLANYVRLDDAGRAPDVVFARSAAEAEAMIDALAARAGGAARAGRRRGPAPGPRPRRAARAAEVLAGHGARGRPEPSSPRWAPTWRPGAVWRRATTCSS